MMLNYAFSRSINIEANHTREQYISNIELHIKSLMTCISSYLSSYIETDVNVTMVHRESFIEHKHAGNHLLNTKHVEYYDKTK